ncbi:VpsF family polysaccharide biosynthesis protein [Aliivibrio sp. S4TY2]|uniref:VpsF family polysaccharide biosynthesis protein n=1 Tax=unclassified Aliivibrio TaxID=2645654 RepID=UPI0023792EAE|nr:MULTISPECIES: VpsF family polysaccharide biosynthesis protein [unclassified Aliivibrio]MDD9156051.1 VpsF family polysaccharide biosynthesis protein [Aliivibrio sp. S4TY2]MDD9159760.1 VpsF family polysaccharide biosynthesis protein [Aliivibrio sp. S4TY1]MDD9163759.1 VpsF family polysaccharide biosynthesis protein [Aliivibrio sp. S4MY2]MDD9167760.1 VpsF family polysaccharide biosynthesis protein [Aliivibrio sp. S4MY4]MDD9185576.1 VpsF family polysaccharide biosynthesis protein [Aliivibrio sp.
MLRPYFICSSVIILAFFLGGYMLEGMGIQYVSEGGTPLFKIHIYSYIILLTIGLFTLKEGVKEQLLHLDTLAKPWLFSVIMVSFVILYGLFRYGTSGMAYIIDTFLTPLLFLLLLSRLNTDECQRLLSLIAGLLLLNSIFAIIEFVSGTRIVSVEFSSFSYFRSSALLTHPLNNALITAGLTLLVFNKTRIPNIIYLSIILLAMFAFGGRAAIGILLLFSAIACIPYVFRFFTHGIEISKQRFAIMLCLFYFAIIAMGFVLIESGITERIMSKLHLDESASARFDVFYLLEQLSLIEWLFGASANLQSAIELYIGISVIENFIIAWIFSFGLICTIPLLLVLITMFGSLTRKVGGLAFMAVPVFFFVSITNNSLTTKTPALLFMITVLFVINKLKNNKQ